MSEQTKVLAMYSAKRKLRHLIGQRLTITNDGQGVTSEILEMIKESHASNFKDEIKLNLIVDHKGICTSIHLSADDWETLEVIGLEDEISNLNEFMRNIFTYGATALASISAAVIFIMFVALISYYIRGF